MNSDNNSLSLTNESDNNKDDNNKNPNEDDKKHTYIKVLVDDPFNNRGIILKVTKKQKGVYV